MMRLVRRMRTAILAGEYKDFTKRFMDKMFPGTFMLRCCLMVTKS